MNLKDAIKQSIFLKIGERVWCAEGNCFYYPFCINLLKSTEFCEYLPLFDLYCIIYSQY